MGLLTKLLIVFGLASIELWAAIPAGLALKLHPVATGVTAALGAIIGVLAILTLGRLARERFLRPKKEVKANKGGRVQRILELYGTAGLGLSAPMVTGAPLAIIVGLALKAPGARLLLWTCIGIIFWSAILTAMGVLGGEFIMRADY